MEDALRSNEGESMKLGSGIAIMGIWMGIGMIAMGRSADGAGAAAAASVLALIATLAIVVRDGAARRDPEDV